MNYCLFIFLLISSPRHGFILTTPWWHDNFLCRILSLFTTFYPSLKDFVTKYITIYFHHVVAYSLHVVDLSKYVVIDFTSKLSRFPRSWPCLHHNTVSLSMNFSLFIPILPFFTLSVILMISSLYSLNSNSSFDHKGHNLYFHLLLT